MTRLKTRHLTAARPACTLARVAEGQGEYRVKSQRTLHIPLAPRLRAARVQ